VFSALRLPYILFLIAVENREEENECNKSSQFGCWMLAFPLGIKENFLGKRNVTL